MSRSDFDQVTPEKGFDARNGSVPSELFQKMDNSFLATPDHVNINQMQQQMQNNQAKFRNTSQNLRKQRESQLNQLSNNIVRIRATQANQRTTEAF
jgi:hypothetical protein